MAVSVRLSESEYNLIKTYADFNNISVSELFRTSVIERIEDEYDCQLLAEAAEYNKKNPKTYSMAEAMKELGIDL